MPQQRLCLVALNPTDSVTEGFLPATAALDLRVTLLTDQPDAHRLAYADQPCPPAEIVGCAVRDPFAVIDHVDRHADTAAVFSNSDHLQTQTALAAAHAGLPGKDWRAALRAKNKAQMRRRLARLGVDRVFSRELPPGTEPGTDFPFPCVVKPREGVASENVMLVADAAELAASYADIRRRAPELPLVVEEYLTGDLHSLETVGDGRGVRVVGGFRTTLSPPPYFVERHMVFGAAPPAAEVAAVLGQLAALGVGFGACHTEYVVADGRVRLVEVNYRAIGDQCDLLLADVTGVPLFEHVLRVHLGQPLPPWPTPTTSAARVDWPCAERGGRLVAAPPATDERRGGAWLRYRPLRELGVDRPLTNTNRDYLGVLRTIGPDQRTVADAAAGFLAARHWDIRP